MNQGLSIENYSLSAMQKSDYQDIELIRLNEVCQLIGMSKATVWAKLNIDSPYYDKAFPKQIRISKRAVAWDKAEVMAWIHLQKDKR